MASMGEKLSPEEVDEMIEELTVQNGKININGRPVGQ